MKEGGGRVEDNVAPVYDDDGDIPEAELELLELGLQVSDDEFAEYESESDDYFYHMEDLESAIIAHLDELEQQEDTNGSTTNNLGGVRRKKPELTNAQRKEIAVTLLHKADDEYKLPKGLLTKIALKYNKCRHTIGRLWKVIVPQVKEGNKVSIKNGKRGKVGRKPKNIDIDQIKAIPLRQRTNLRTFAAALGVSPSLVHRLLKRGVLRRHSNAIKPTLKEHNKLERIQWALSMIIPRTVHQPPRWRDMYNFVHVDEKWFFLSKLTQRYYLLPSEDEPDRHCQSKKFIPKVMFMSAVSRPYDDFDGKIGIFPFVEGVAAIRSSKNRVAGTIEVKAIQSITKEVIREAFIKELIPAIRRKWPQNACKTIWLQQDNARPHISPQDTAFVEAATSDGFNIKLINQPANSPDLNTLDLGYFAGVQSIQHQKCPRNVEELLTAVQEAYEEYEPRKLNHTWLHLQMVMNEILRVNGANNYKNPHKGKNKLEKQGELPTSFEVDDELIRQATAYLEEGQINSVHTQATRGRGRNKGSSSHSTAENCSQTGASTSNHNNETNGRVS